MFITEAYAAASSSGSTDPSGGLISFVPIIFMFIIFYFLLIRPQQKRAKEHAALLAGLRRGDMVVTAGGIIAKVSKVNDSNEIELEIAQGVKINVIKSTIATVLSRTEPVKE